MPRRPLRIGILIAQRLAVKVSLVERPDRPQRPKDDALLHPLQPRVQRRLIVP